MTHRTEMASFSDLAEMAAVFVGGTNAEPPSKTKIPKSNGYNVFIVRCSWQRCAREKTHTRNISSNAHRAECKSPENEGTSAFDPWSNGGAFAILFCSFIYYFSLLSADARRHTHLASPLVLFSIHGPMDHRRVYFHLNKPLMIRVCVVFLISFHLHSRPKFICVCLTVISLCIWCRWRQQATT